MNLRPHTILLTLLKQGVELAKHERLIEKVCLY